MPRAVAMILDKQVTHDCAPTLSDAQVVDFCRDGVLIFDGVVPEHINTRCFEFLDAHAADEANINVRAARGGKAPLAFSYVNLFCMALLYGGAGRLTARNGGFRAGSGTAWGSRPSSSRRSGSWRTCSCARR